jgi:hypothetical protein
VRVASGPLLKFWKQYSKEETMPDYAPPDVLYESEHGIRVRVRKPVEIRGHAWPVGTVLHVPKAEVWRQIKHRSLEELPPEVESVPIQTPLVADVQSKRRGRPPKAKPEMNHGAV